MEMSEEHERDPLTHIASHIPTMSIPSERAKLYDLRENRPPGEPEMYD